MHKFNQNIHECFSICPDLTADFTVGSPSGQKAAQLQELEIRYRFGEKISHKLNSRSRRGVNNGLDEAGAGGAGGGRRGAPQKTIRNLY